MKIELLIGLFLIKFIVINAQHFENVHFEQKGNYINLYYDLIGSSMVQCYNVSLYYTMNGGETWIGPIKKVSGNIGTKQKPGTNKKIVWNVLEEVDEIKGDIEFQIKAIPSKIEVSIISTPADAGIYLNGVYSGRTPRNHIYLTPGEFTLEIRRYHYITVKRKITVSSESHDFIYVLKPVKEENHKTSNIPKIKKQTKLISINKYYMLTYGWHPYEFGFERGYGTGEKDIDIIMGWGMYYKFPFNKRYKAMIDYKDDISDDIFIQEDGYYNKFHAGLYVKAGLKIYVPFPIIPHANLGMDYLIQKKLYKADRDYIYTYDGSQHELKTDEYIIVKNDRGLIDNTLYNFTISLGLGLDIPVYIFYLSFDTFLISADRIGYKFGLGLYL